MNRQDKKDSRTADTDHGRTTPSTRHHENQLIAKKRCINTSAETQGTVLPLAPSTSLSIIYPELSPTPGQVRNVLPPCGMDKALGIHI